MQHLKPVAGPASVELTQHEPGKDQRGAGGREADQSGTDWPDGNQRAAGSGEADQSAERQGERLRRTVVQVVGSPGVDQFDEAVLTTVDMAAHGFDVAVLAPPPNGLQRWHPYSNLASGVVQYGPHLGSLNPESGSVSAFLWLVQWLRSVSPDLVHGHGRAVGPVVAVAASVAGIPSVISLHPTDGPWGRGARLALRRATTVASLTGGNGKPPTNRAVSTSFGIELPRPETAEKVRVEARARFGVEAPVIIAAPVPRHRAAAVELTARAFVDARLDGAVLVLVGDGDSWLRLQSLRHGLGAPTSIVVETELTEAEVVAAADLVISSDLASDLNPSTVLAAALGIPAIAFRSGDGVGRGRWTGPGRLVDPGDPDGLTTAVRDLAGLVAAGPVPVNRTGLVEVHRLHSARAVAESTARLWRETLAAGTSDRGD